MIAFDRSEYLARLAQTKLRMQESRIDTLLISSPENINYLTGYDASSFYTPQGVVVSLDHEEPLLILREMDVACAEFTSFVSAGNVVGYGEEWIGRPDRHVMSNIAHVIAQRAGHRSSLGVELDSAFYTARCHREMERALPASTFIDASQLVNWIRVVKSEREVEYMREAAVLASCGMRAALDAVAPGIRECDAAASIMSALISGENSVGGGFPKALFIMQGRRAAAPHLDWSDAAFELRTPVSIELGGCRLRYHAGLARTIHLGDPPAKLARLAETAVSGLEAALAAIQPGVTCADVHAACQRVLRAAGYEKLSRIGYSIGLGFAPTWIEGTASLQAEDATELRPNMVFHVICGMWRGEHNVEVSETVRVTDAKSEVLTSFPRDLLVK